MSLRATAVMVLCLCAGLAAARPLDAGDLPRVRKAADAGSPAARFDLGRMYRNGIGVAPDVARAFALIESAARAGHPGAMFMLNNMLATGEGAPKDEALARRWLEQAAEREHPEALQQLSMNLQQGAMGYARDERRAAQLMDALAHAMKHQAHDH